MVTELCANLRRRVLAQAEDVGPLLDCFGVVRVADDRIAIAVEELDTRTVPSVPGRHHANYVAPLFRGVSDGTAGARAAIIPPGARLVRSAASSRHAG